MLKFYKTSVLTAFIATLSMVSWGQSISGVVTDEENRPIPGAFVLVKGTSNGTASDQVGNYTLTTGVGTFEIEVKALNFETTTKQITVPVGAVVKHNFKLSSGTLTLDNVEIIGYGVERNRPSTGSIAKISGKDISAIRTPSFEAALQGQAAGLQVSQGSGIAGAGSLIRIRGTASVSAGGDPLYIIDGIPMTQDYFLRGNSGALNNNPLATINPNDIEKVEVRKDAAAAGEYGSRAANGVIIITTKRAKEKGWKFDYGLNAGISTPASRPNMLNTDQYLRIRQEAWENDGGTGYVWLPNMTSATDDAATRKAA
jgi:TonB-dependent SusC/RagA subfamily outer membrane receptor